MFFVAAKMPKEFEAILCGVRELSKRHKQHAVKQWQRESEKGTGRGRGRGRRRDHAAVGARLSAVGQMAQHKNERKK